MSNLDLLLNKWLEIQLSPKMGVKDVEAFDRLIISLWLEEKGGLATVFGEDSTDQRGSGSCEVELEEDGTVPRDSAGNGDGVVDGH